MWSVCAEIPPPAIWSYPSPWTRCWRTGQSQATVPRLELDLCDHTAANGGGEKEEAQRKPKARWAKQCGSLKKDTLNHSRVGCERRLVGCSRRKGGQSPPSWASGGPSAPCLRRRISPAWRRPNKLWKQNERGTFLPRLRPQHRLTVKALLWIKTFIPPRGFTWSLTGRALWSAGSTRPVLVRGTTPGTPAGPAWRRWATPLNSHCSPLVTVETEDSSTS